MRFIRFHLAIASKGIKDRSTFSYVYNNNTNKMNTISEIMHFYCSSSIFNDYPLHFVKVASEDLVNLSKQNIISAYITSIEEIKSRNKSAVISTVNSKIMGKVTLISQNKIQIDNDYWFKITCENTSKFHPMKGDIVIIERKLNSETQTEIITISPFRLIDFDGIISEFKRTAGYVDDKIFINSSISKNIPLKFGTKVYGIAMQFVKKDRLFYRALHLSIINTETENEPTINIDNELNYPVDRNPQKITTIYGNVLKFYTIPSEIEHSAIDNAINLLDKYPILNETICPENYEEKLRLLIYLEEIQVQEEMKKFQLQNVRLIRRFGAFEVEVPGLNDGRLSLMIGHKVGIQLECEQSTYRVGSIIDIDCDRIFVQTDPAFTSSYTDQNCTISFRHSRIPFRRMHFGIDIAVSVLMKFGIVFPDRIPPSIQKLDKSTNDHHKRELLDLSEMKFFNSALNQQQQLAVLRIVRGLSRPLPYVLFGPPGTGKTVTLVETILQIYKNDPSSRILICAPSNSAVDLLCVKLRETGLITNGDMVRMVSKQQLHLIEMLDNHNDVDQILPINMSIDKVQSILTRRLILSTCNTSEALYHVYRKPGHITHVFIDEAGQASEPDVMIPIGLISPENGQILLSGDPMQLGPVICSPRAKQLEKSFLERLLYSCKIYQNSNNSEQTFNPLLCTQLIHNYRSHPSLLQLPSNLFYNGSLIACAKNPKFEDWKWLPNSRVPFIFHHVQGKEFHGNKMTSISNKEEAKLVLKWIQRLLRDFTNKDGIDASHINVITPYRAQVECISKLLMCSFPSHVVNQLKVASVEEFQGQENEVVIVSTVRSSLGVRNQCYESRLKFLSNNKRFNVSITRARSLLIVIGDQSLLKHEPCWNKLIKYAIMNKALI